MFGIFPKFRLAFGAAQSRELVAMLDTRMTFPFLDALTAYPTTPFVLFDLQYIVDLHGELLSPCLTALIRRLIGRLCLNTKKLRSSQRNFNFTPPVHLARFTWATVFTT